MTMIRKTEPDKTCPGRGCGADLFFVTTERGKIMPIDAETAPCAFDGCGHPWPMHEEIVCDGDGCGPHDFRLELGYNAETMVSHFTTCPEPGSFSRRKR